MPWKLVGCGAVLLAALVVGVGGAVGRGLDTTTVLVEVLGGGEVSGGGGQIGCGAGLTDCYATYVSGTSTTLTASGGAGWSFSGWSECSSQAGATCTVSLDGSSHEVTASFTPTGASPGDSTLTVSAPTDASGGGGEVSDPDGNIDCGSSNSVCTWTDLTGSTFTVLEAPDSGYGFDGWGGACSGADPSCTVTMSGDQSVSASFSQASGATTLAVSVTGDGTVSGGGIACTSAGGAGCTATETPNDQVTLTATPAAAAGFVGWGGACAGTSPTCVVTMDSAKTVTAAFGSGTSAGTFPLSVAVVGDGTVTGGGVDCGGSGSACTANVASGSSVTLAAQPGSGASFSGWSGACAGAASTCTVTVNGATSVTATFSGASTGGGSPRLVVAVSGPGRVTGLGIACGNGATACSVAETGGRTVTLTATPADGASFAGWSGPCRGTSRTCRAVVSGTTSVGATFRAAGAPPPSGSTLLLRSRGRPLVRRTAAGYTVTLRFRLAQRRTVSVRALRAGRAEAAFSFTAPAGPATVGPFPLAKPGWYRFEVAVAGGSLRWAACLGRCGAAAGRAAFTFARRPPVVSRAGRMWSVRLRFRSSVAAGVEVRVLRGGVLTRDVSFAVGAGSARGKAVLLAPGGYSFDVVAVDAYGRVRTLTWIAALP